MIVFLMENPLKYEGMADTPILGKLSLSIYMQPVAYYMGYSNVIICVIYIYIYMYMHIRVYGLLSFGSWDSHLQRMIVARLDWSYWGLFIAGLDWLYGLYSLYFMFFFSD